MTGNTIGIFYDRWKRIQATPTSFRNPITFLEKGVCFKANPRTFEYMKALFAERYPHAEILVVGRGSLAADTLKGASKVVLLYPDSIGIGFAPIERAVMRDAPHVPIEVMNGRRRAFAFDGKSKWALRYRRFLEWTMLPEIFATAIILIITPFLLLTDLARGRK